MKTKLSLGNLRKILLILILTIFSASNIFAFSSATNLRNHELQMIDLKVERIFNSIRNNSDSQLSVTLYEVKKSNLDLEASIYTDGNEKSVIVDSQSNLPPISLKAIKDNSNFRKEFKLKNNSFAVYELNLNSGDKLVLLAPLNSIQALYKSALSSSLINYNLIGLISGFLLFFIFVLYRNFINESHLEFMQDHLSDIAHELRTPLTVIKGYSELIDKNYHINTFDSPKALNALRREVSRMEALISDLLFLSEIREKLKSSKSEIDLSETARIHFEDFTKLYPTHTTELIAPNKCLILANQSHIDRLFQNILSNIVRHTSEITEVKCSISILEKSVILFVEDSGPGLHPKFYKEQSSALSRFDSSRSKTAGGSGLGLNIIYAIVKENNGSLNFEKSSLGGLGIRIVFPRV